MFDVIPRCRGDWLRVRNRHFQVGFVVFQKAKLRVLLFCYDCLDKFLTRRDFGVLCDSVDEAVCPK